jgi:uncharacterized protein related to proFAR isomerase
MMLIPVIDLMRGEVVRAVRGDRQAYRPIVSRLAEGSEPVRLAEVLTRHCATDRLYVADLDALTGAAPQVAALRTLLRALPALELWLDAGFAGRDDALRLGDAVGAETARIVPVFGSESIATPAALARCFADGAPGILSLDRRDGTRLDRAGCWERPEHWPARVIVMTLERVGADAGPDLQTLAAVQARSPQTRLVGAGGIRDAADLDAAAAAGADAWLVASALHDGRLPPAAR